MKSKYAVERLITRIFSFVSVLLFLLGLAWLVMEIGMLGFDAGAMILIVVALVIMILCEVLIAVYDIADSTAEYLKLLKENHPTNQ